MCEFIEKKKLLKIVLFYKKKRKVRKKQHNDKFFVIISTIYNIKITQLFYLNQFHLWLEDDWFDDVDFDVVDDDVGIFWVLLVGGEVVGFVRIPRFIIANRFINFTELLDSAFRCSSNAVRKNDIVVSWCLSCVAFFLNVFFFIILLVKFQL